MKLDQNLAAVMLLGLTAGEFRMPRGMTDGNRLHMERAPRGSQAERDRMAAAEAKRQRKLAKRRAS
jgi:hypothetical protein